MLLDIQKMPDAFGIPLNRRVTIYSGHHLESMVTAPYVYWPTVPLYHHKLHVGAMVTKKPHSLYKAIHLSYDAQWVFETVFAMEHDIGNKPLCLALYTKMISAKESTLAISVNAINFYQDERPSLSPINNLIAPLHRDPQQSYQAALTFTSTASDLIVPPLFDEIQLWKYIDTISAIRSSGVSHDQLGWSYKPLYDYEPQVFEALMLGHFTQSPFHQLMGYHPSIEFDKPKWFTYEEISYSQQARGLEVSLNHPAFDALALGIISLFPGKISLQCTMMHAIDGLRDLWLTRHYHNPYRHVLHPSSLTSGYDEEFFYRHQLETIFYQSAMAYCQIYAIDSKIFLERPAIGFIEESSITITKSFMDEIVFTFHDLKADRYVSFYTSFPALMLATMAVGWY